MALQPVLINGEWRASDAVGTVRGHQPIDEDAAAGYLSCVERGGSRRSDPRRARSGGRAAGNVTGSDRATSSKLYADAIEARTDALVDLAYTETALPKSPRLRDVELPRTTDQLRQAAAAARERSWCLATIDTKRNIRAMYGPLGGPVVVFGPNNFPFAFNSAAGGDFAAAIAAGNPVIAKANTGHPGTTRLFAEAALEAIQADRYAEGAGAVALPRQTGRRLPAGEPSTDRRDGLHRQPQRRDCA